MNIRNIILGAVAVVVALVLILVMRSETAQPESVQDTQDVGMEAQYEQPKIQDEFLVALGDIEEGEKVTANKFEWKAYSEADKANPNITPYIYKSANPDAIEKLNNKMAIKKVRSGEPASFDSFVDRKGSIMSSTLPKGGVAFRLLGDFMGWIQPGDRVDLNITFSNADSLATALELALFNKKINHPYQSDIKPSTNAVDKSLSLVGRSGRYSELLIKGLKVIAVEDRINKVVDYKPSREVVVILTEKQVELMQLLVSLNVNMTLSPLDSLTADEISETQGSFGKVVGTFGSIQDDADKQDRRVSIIKSGVPLNKTFAVK